MRGKLVKKYRNRIQRVKRVLKDCSESNEKSSNDQTSKESLEATGMTEESVDWLKKNNEPWELAETHWNITSGFRKNQFRAMKSGKIGDCIEKWAILRHPMGYKLIKKDFDDWKFCATENAVAQWPEFFSNLQAIVGYII